MRSAGLGESLNVEGSGQPCEGGPMGAGYNVRQLLSGRHGALIGGGSKVQTALQLDRR